MSTKIFNAYIYRGPKLTSPAQLFALAERIQDTLTPKCKDLFYKKVAEELAHQVDFASVRSYSNESVRNKTAGSMVTEQYDGARAELRKGLRAPQWDFNAEVAFYQLKDKLLLRVFAENDVVSIFQKAFPEFKDYHSQNSCDKPSRISKKEWDTREKDWDIAYRDRKATAKRIGCLTFTLWGEYSGPSLWEREEALARIPAFQKRVQKAATDFVRDRWCRSRISPDSPPHAWSGVFFDWMDAAKTDPITQRIATIAKAFALILPKKIVLETVQTPNGDLRRAALKRLRAHFRTQSS